MKIVVQHEELASRLSSAARVAVGKGANASLSGVQIVAKDGSVELRATNMESSLRNPLLAKIEEEGVVLLPARVLMDVVKSLPKENVTITHQPVTQDVKIEAGSSEFTLRTLRNEEFPKLPQAEEEKTWSVESKAFAETVAQVSRSASRDESRPLLTGIWMSVVTQEGVLRMVATDSYRLAIKTTALESVPEEDFQAIVPARALEEAVRISAGEKAEALKIGLGEGQIVFSVGDTVLTSRMIDGKFPDYKQLVPQEFSYSLVFNRKEILERVERIGLMAQKGTPLRFCLNEEGLKLTAQSAEIGDASDQMPLEWNSEELETGFNPQYLIEGLKSTESEQVELKLINALKPGLLESSDGSGFQYLIMPVRLGL